MERKEKIFLCVCCAKDLAGNCCRQGMEFGVIYETPNNIFQLSTDCSICDSKELTDEQFFEFQEYLCELS